MSNPSLRGRLSARSNPSSRKFFALALAAIIILAIITSLFLPHSLTASVKTLTENLRNLGPLGWLIFIMVEAAIALVGILPASLLGIAAGAVYGITGGFITSALGILLGAAIAFSLSRSLARPLITHFIGNSKRVRALDDLLTQDSWRLVALLRVSPIMPFSLTSYALGLSGISSGAYICGTLASLPALLGYVVIGTLGDSSLNSQSLIHNSLLILGAAATLALTIHLTKLLTRALKSA